MGKKYILVGAGDYGQRALHFFGIKNVFCFADNYKKGICYCEKQVISIDELYEVQEKYDVVLTVNDENIDVLSEQLISKGIKFKKYTDILLKYIDNDVWNHKIAKWKDKFRGKKVFLIGTGPSLKVKDLETIQQNGYKTFACNFINRIFGKTEWRPDLYCCEEKSATILNYDFIMNYHMDVKFIGNLDNYEESKLFLNAPDEVLFYLRGSAANRFSEDLSKVVYGGHTVMFSMIQFAAYMGFSEIFLLGVDNTQPPSPHTSGFVEAKSHFYEDDNEEINKRREIYFKHKYADDWDEYTRSVNSSYEVAREYCNSQGILIRNATRGGRLEVFDRVDIDKLFKRVR